ncbi:MAG: hypothetical protein GX952_00740 [Firmicutes bacterium]|nr:hypothetical protein [Bacillota bacterium]
MNRNRTKDKTLRWLTAMVTALVLLTAVSTPGRRQRQAVWAQAVMLIPKTVVLDPGHGGIDTGATGKGGVAEKEITLPVCLRLKKYLDLSGVKVVLTRSDDKALSPDYREDLKLRADIVKKSKASLFISIHGNSFPAAGEYGAQTFYYDNHSDSKRLATYLQAELKKIALLGENYREVQQGDFYVLRNSPVAAVLVEVGFLSNPKEERLLADPSYQKLLAWHLFSGLVAFWRDQEMPNRFLTPVGLRSTIETGR